MDDVADDFLFVACVEPLLFRLTGWHRSHARKALAQALRPRVVRTRRPRTPTYGPDVVVALRFCWAVLGAPTGKRLAPVIGELVAHGSSRIRPFSTRLARV